MFMHVIMYELRLCVPENVSQEPVNACTYEEEEEEIGLFNMVCGNTTSAMLHLMSVDSQ